MQMRAMQMLFTCSFHIYVSRTPCIYLSHVIYGLGCARAPTSRLARGGFEVKTISNIYSPRHEWELWSFGIISVQARAVTLAVIRSSPASIALEEGRGGGGPGRDGRGRGGRGCCCTRGGGGSGGRISHVQDI